MAKEFISVGLFFVLTVAAFIVTARLWRRGGRTRRAAGIVGIAAAYLALTYLVSLWVGKGGWPEGMFFMMIAVFVVPAAVLVLVVLLIMALFGYDGTSRRPIGLIVSFTLLGLIILAAAFNQYLRLAWYRMDINDPDPDERAYAVLMIGETGIAAAGPVIVSALHDPDPHVRENAVLALASLDDPNTLPMAREALADEDAGVREMAVIVVVPLGRGGPEVVADLRRMLDDPDPRVREAAAGGLDGIDPGWRSAPDTPEEYRRQ
jgi:hypothetical protein